MTRLAILLAAGGLMGAAPCLHAQGSAVSVRVSYRSGPPMPVEPALAQALLTSMKMDLRNLLSSQEMFFADHSRYGRSLGATGDTAKVQVDPSPGVLIALTYVTTNTWTARAIHAWIPDLSCVIAVGAIPPSRQLKTARDRKVATEDGVPVCDTP